MILSCLVMIVSLANINLFKKEEASGSFYEQSSDEYTCQIVPGETVIKQNFKPRYNGLTTLSVRIENEKINQMTGDLLFQIQKDDEVLWEKLIDENEITNWRYVDLDVSEIDLDRELYTLSISCPKNEKTFPYRIYLAETSPKEEQQLFCNNDKETGKLDIVYTYSSSTSARFTATVSASSENPPAASRPSFALDPASSSYTPSFFTAPHTKTVMYSGVSECIVRLSSAPASSAPCCEAFSVTFSSELPDIVTCSSPQPENNNVIVSTHKYAKFLIIFFIVRHLLCQHRITQVYCI